MWLLGLLLGLAAADAVGSGSVLRDGAQVCEVVRVVSPDTPKARGRFSATTVLDLEFRTSVKRKVAAAHRLRFRVFTPKGHLYQELIVPFAGDGSARTPIRARLPVGGTSISTSSLYGRWKVVPHLDGFTKPCAATTQFTIAP
jgi:hypothetical protein